MKKELRDVPVKKNERMTVTIVDLTYDGRGVAKVDGFPIFIEEGIPGERVQIHILKVMKKFAFAKITSWEEKSEDRVESVEKNLIRTGIAPLHHIKYSRQLEFKQQQVEQAMKRIGGFDNIEVTPTIGMTDPTHYRNKAQIPVRMMGGDVELGFFRKNSHDLIVVEDYLIQDERIDEILLFLKAQLNEFNIKPYDEKQNTGHLKNIVIRRGHYSGEVMVMFVTRKKKIFYLQDIVENLKNEFPDVVSVLQNVQSKATNKVIGDTIYVLYGREYITDELLGKTYRISAQSFYQINTVQAEKTYEKAIELADLKKTDVVLDAYCGIGTIGLSLADKVDTVYGVDVVPEAIDDAKRNAKLNKVDNAIFGVGHADIVLKQWTEEKVKFNVIVVDPPRKGLTEEFITESVELNPEKIIYISCDPSTLARDMKLYAEHGYTASVVSPVDMFPQTTHVETVALLSHQ